MVGATVPTGTGRKPDMPQSPAQIARFDGEIMKKLNANEMKCQTNHIK